MASRKPFSRHRGRAPADPERALLAAYEFAASEYRWLPTDIEDGLTDEILVAYFDAAIDRRRSASDVRFREMVEAVRIGTLVARDPKLYSRWRADVSAEAKGLAQLIRDSGGAIRERSEFRN